MVVWSMILLLAVVGAYGLYIYRVYKETVEMKEAQELREEQIKYQRFIMSRPPETKGITPTAVKPKVKLDK